MNKCFIICWFGDLPEYFPVWIKTCESNPGFDYLLIADADVKYRLPENIKVIKFTKEKFLDRVHKRISAEANFKKPYRLCDFRPMYGVIFQEELQNYDFWGYCDVDLVFGCIAEMLPDSLISKYDAVFSGGHFTLIKNDSILNNMYKRPGSLFNYQTVVKKDAIYAFDETTGIQRIFKENNINALYGVPYIETESKYIQLRSRMDRTNPDNQAYYWEKGHLYRAKLEDSEFYYQEIIYIHLQKRDIKILDSDVINSESFWITPYGYSTKTYLGKPTKEDIIETNPNDGETKRRIQKLIYSVNKLWTILNRNSYQKYVRLRQQKAGINSEDASREELMWTKY